MIKYINIVYLLTHLHLVRIAVCKTEYLMHVELKPFAILVQCKESYNS